MLAASENTPPGEKTIKLKTTYLYFILAACLVSLIGLMNQAVVAKQLDNWQVLPKPQRLSELYFASAESLPTAVISGANQTLSFMVHNVEHRTTQYHYRLLAVSSDGRAVRQLGDGALTLGHDESRSITHIISWPSIGNHVAIKVELEYEAVSSKGTRELQRQSIHHWVQVTGLRP